MLCPVPVIASGGAGTLDHLVAGIRDGHATAVLAASIFHFGEFAIGEAKRAHGDGRPPRSPRSVITPRTMFTLEDLAKIIAARARAGRRIPIRRS